MPGIGGDMTTREFLTRYHWTPAYRVSDERLDACVVVGALWVVLGVVALVHLLWR